MNQLEYLPGIAGQSVHLDGPSAFVGVAEEMRSREWDYDLGYRDLVTATRPARTVDVTFHADYDTADILRRVADADVMARTPGTFVAQKEWKQRGYILASDVDDIHYGRLSTGLKIALLDGAWWRLAKRSFVPEITTPEYRSATGETVTASGASGAPLHALTIDGKAVQDGTPTPSEPVPIEVIEPRNLFGAPIAGWISGGASSYNQLSGLGGSTGTLFVAEIPSNTTFTISVKLFTGMNRFRISLFDADPRSGAQFATGHFSQLASVNDPTTDRTYTFPSGEFTWVVLGLSTSASAMNPNAQAQLETGSAATPYVAPGCIGLVVGNAATSIPLQGNVLASLPDGTRDTVTVDGAGHCVLTKRVGMINVGAPWNSVYSFATVTGGARWYVTPGAMSSAYSQQIPDGSVNGYSTMAKFVKNSSGLSTLGDHMYTYDNRVYYVISGITTSTEAVDWVNSHNATVAYPLTTPQIIDLGTIDMPAVPLDAQIRVTAAVTPTITAEWQISRDAYLDYPHNYPYDYQKTSSTESITPSVLTPSDVYLAIFGPAVNPYVIVGGNRYQVNVTVPSGGYLVVDGRDKTINLTLADGTVQNVFSSGVRGGGAGGGSYIFEKVPAGTSEVTYDGSFGFDLGWYEEEGEPPWNQS